MTLSRQFFLIIQLLDGFLNPWHFIWVTDRQLKVINMVTISKTDKQTKHNRIPENLVPITLLVIDGNPDSHNDMYWYIYLCMSVGFTKKVKDKYPLTLSNVLFTNEWGLSNTWNTGGADPITRHLVTRIAAPVISRNRWRTHRLLNHSPDGRWKNISRLLHIFT